jgi:hypothetical protein
MSRWHGASRSPFTAEIHTYLGHQVPREVDSEDVSGT